MRRSPHPDQLGLGFRVEEMTRVPQSDWTPPSTSDLPDRLHGDVGIDTETCDYGLQKDRGSGWGWSGGGFVAGYSVSADNFRGYLPVAHAEGPNLDHSQVRRWLNHVLSDERQTKVFANAMYDMAWSRRDGVEIRGPIVDVQWAEALLDEYRMSYSLDSIAKDRVGRSKDEALLRDAAGAYGVDPKKDLWKLSSRFVGPYAESDADLPREIWNIQQPLIQKEKLTEVFDLEHELIPLYLDMRMQGVRIDEDHVAQVRKHLVDKSKELNEELKRRVGFEVNVWAANSVARAFDREGLSYGRTLKTGAPSITKDLLRLTDHWLSRLVMQIREAEKLISTFVDSQIIEQIHRGRIHAEIHPLKSDDGGTVTGRLSMSNPNLQFIPVRTEEGQLIRRAFLPEDGELFGSADYNQQEVRLLVHFAFIIHLTGAAEARDRYINDPSTNYHEFVAELTELVYKHAKIINFAIIYGRGIGETARELGKTEEETQALFDKHAEGIPFARELSAVCQGRVRQNGFIKSLSGRRMRFNLWEPARWEDRTSEMLPLDKAQERWPNQRLTLARIHKSLNSLIQPSAADQMKRAMVEVARAGLGRHLRIQVHDELCCSLPEGRIGEQIAEIMREAVPLSVPSKVDLEVGPNWRDAK